MSHDRRGTAHGVVMDTPELIRSVGTARWKTVDGHTHQALIGPDLLGEALFDADRIRVGAQYQRQRNYHGWYAVASTGSHVWHESLLERASVMLLDHAAGPLAIASQPVRLEWDDRVRTPDYLVLHSDGTQTLIDVKPSSRLTGDVLDGFEATAAICQTVGWAYRVMTELSDQKRINLDFLSHFRLPVYALAADVVDGLVERLDGSTFEELVAAIPVPTVAEARALALGVLWRRQLTFDLETRLTNETRLARPSMFGIEAVDAIRQ